MSRSNSLTFSERQVDPSSKPDIGALGRWMVAIVAIRFDLEQGQLVEDCYPPGALSGEEETDVAFSSFPDSMTSVHNRASLHDTLFFFRVRRRGTPQRPTSPTPATSTTRFNGRNGEGRGEGSGSGNDSMARYRRSIDPNSITSPGGNLERLREREKQRDRAVSDGEVSGSGRGVEDGSTSKRNASNSWGSNQFDAYSDAASSPGSNSPLTERERDGRRRLDFESSSSPSRTGNGVDNNRGNGSGNSHRNSGGTDSGSERGSERPSGGSMRGEGSFGIGGSNVGRLGPGSGGTRYLYGFVFNRQRHDERLRRGGEQKSIVVLTERPYSSVFRPLVKIAGPLYFDIGSSALEQIALYVSHWPPPLHGTTMELPTGSVVIRSPLPPAHTLPPSNQTPLDDFTSAMAPAPLSKSVPQGIFYEADLFGMYRGVLMQLWVLWELLLVGEPLLIIAPSPSQCSEAVAALVGLTAPLPCSMDFRPYFTIHDPDFQMLNALKHGDPVPPMVLGVTNLHFLKAFRNLPHVVSVGTPPSQNGPVSSRFAGNSGLLHPNSQVTSKASPARLQLDNYTQHLSPLRRFSASSIFSRVARIRKEGPLSLMTEHKEALWTNYQPSTKQDTTILNRLVDGPAGNLPSAASETLTVVNNEMLRRHFVELTTNFLAPFGPYLRAAAPPQGASPFRDPPPLSAFDAHEFLEQMAARGPGKFLAKRLQQGSWLELYRKFLEGPNFMPWFQRRRAVAEAEQHKLWRKARLSADVRTFLQTMDEVELIDAFTSLEKHIWSELQLAGYRSGLPFPETPTIFKLRNDLRILYNSLPRDLQQMLLFNPQHSSLLQGGGREPSKLPGRPSLQSSRDGVSLSGSPKNFGSGSPKNFSLGVLGASEGFFSSSSSGYFSSTLGRNKEPPGGFPGSVGMRRGEGEGEVGGRGRGGGGGREGEGEGERGELDVFSVDDDVEELLDSGVGYSSRSFSISTVPKFSISSPVLGRRFSASAGSTPRVKSNAVSPPSQKPIFGSWDWGTNGKNESEKGQNNRGGMLSYFSRRVESEESGDSLESGKALFLIQRGEREGDQEGEEREEEEEEDEEEEEEEREVVRKVATGLDPNPFNPLY